MGIAKWIAAGIGIAALGSVSANAQSRQTEEPAYDVVADEEGFELRDYKPMVVAEITHKGSRRRAGGASFQRLAAYIFGQDRPAGGDYIPMTAPVITNRVDQNEIISMTAPVIQEASGEDTWRMRFVMPAKYTLATLPAAPADITLAQVPARRMASVRFNGYANDGDIAIMEQLLSDWIKRKGYTVLGPAEFASYDAPRVLGPYRRNEVMFEVATE